MRASVVSGGDAAPVLELGEQVFDPMAVSDAICEHGRIAQAISASDVKAAADAMRDHIRGSQRRFTSR